MKIGLFIGGAGSAGTLQDQIAQVVEAERAGFDSLWAAHIMDVDVMTMLSMAAEQTTRIEMGTAVTPTFLRHPIAMAQQALTLQNVANGRFTLGIGVNHKPVVENRLGMKFHRPWRHMFEYQNIIHALTREGKVDYQGEIFSADTQFTMPSLSEVPMLLAALGPRMLNTAGELADGTITWMTGTETLKSYIVPTINEAANKAGRKPPRIVAAVPLTVTDDRETAFKASDQYFGRYGQLPSYRAMLDREGVESSAEMALIGNEREVEEMLKEYSAAGVTDLAVQIFTAGSGIKDSSDRTMHFLSEMVGEF